MTTTIRPGHVGTRMFWMRLRGGLAGGAFVGLLVTASCRSPHPVRDPARVQPARQQLLAGNAAFDSGDETVAWEHYVRALRLAGSLPAPSPSAAASSNHGSSDAGITDPNITDDDWSLMGNRSETSGFERLSGLDQLRSVETPTEHAATSATALNQMGLIAEQRGALAEAVDLYRTSLRLQQAIDEPEREIAPRLNLASVLFSLGELAESEQQARRALDLATASGSPIARGQACRVLGEVVSARGDLTRGRSHLERSVVWLERSGQTDSAAASRLVLARVLLRQGAPKEALTELSLARHRFDAANDHQGVFRSLAGMARAYRALEQPETALTFWDRALELAALQRSLAPLAQQIEEEVRATRAEIPDRRTRPATEHRLPTTPNRPS